MTKISYSGYRFPPEIIHQAIWLYLRFTLSFRDVEDLLAERGIAISYETVRRWVKSFRADHCSGIAKAPSQTAFDLASGRGLSENRWVHGLPVARRRRRGRGSGCAGPVQAQQARRVETDAQTSKEIRRRSRANGDGWFAVLRRSDPRSRHRPSA